MGRYQLFAKVITVYDHDTLVLKMLRLRKPLTIVSHNLQISVPHLQDMLENSLDSDCDKSAANNF